jgi:hypothetical protein
MDLLPFSLQGPTEMRGLDLAKTCATVTLQSAQLTFILGRVNVVVNVILLRWWQLSCDDFQRALQVETPPGSTEHQGGWIDKDKHEPKMWYETNDAGGRQLLKTYREAAGGLTRKSVCTIVFL